MSDATVTEGTGGNNTALVTVSVANVGHRDVTVDYVTADGTAVASSDYSGSSGRVVFRRGGPTSVQIAIPVATDGAVEANETFVVRLANPTGGATIADDEGIVTIVDDDRTAPPPATLSVSDAAIVEGNSGSQQLVFTVTLTNAPSSSVSVNYTTMDGSARAASDYTATSGALTFAPTGSSTFTRTVNVPVVGDNVVEPDEVLYLNLTSPSGASISDSQGVGIIRNDDTAIEQPVFDTVDFRQVCDPDNVSPYTHACWNDARYDFGPKVAAGLSSNGFGSVADKPIVYPATSEAGVDMIFSHLVSTAETGIRYRFGYTIGTGGARVDGTQGSWLTNGRLIARAEHTSCSTCVVSIEKVIVGRNTFGPPYLDDGAEFGESGELVFTLVNTAGGVVPAGNINIVITPTAVVKAVPDSPFGVAAWEGSGSAGLELWGFRLDASRV